MSLLLIEFFLFNFFNYFYSFSKKLSSLGFSKEKASSAYYASGKNENLAANILLFNQGIIIIFF